MFLDLRREKVKAGDKGTLKPYRRLLTFEKLGSTRIFRYFFAPAGADTIFFPGCALPGARPDHTLKLYAFLQRLDPDIGIMLDCCNKPSHDLGRQQFFDERSQKKIQFLTAHGIQHIITACPNCFQTFSQYYGNFRITSAYTVIAESGLIPQQISQATCAVHDPCSIRFHQEIHQAVRTISRSLGVNLVEMGHNRETTLCCGQGGATGCLGGGYAAGWSEKRHEEISGRQLLTYCAGCTDMLQRYGKVNHIVDLLFPDAGNDHISPRPIRAPETYLNRLKLKRLLKRLQRDET
jgi:Fe-S oxidoreductase